MVSFLLVTLIGLFTSSATVARVHGKSSNLVSVEAGCDRTSILSSCLIVIFIINCSLAEEIVGLEARTLDISSSHFRFRAGGWLSLLE
jgi:hypothetical protein